MEIINLKHQNFSHICKFPLTDNTNSFPIFGFTKTFNFVKQNWYWIGLISFLSFIGFQVILMRIKWGNLDPIAAPAGSEYPLGDFVGFMIIGLVAVLCAGLTWGKAGPSGRTRITRPRSDSVDGFGAARGYDYSHGGGGSMGKGPLPVSLRTERKRTDTFRDGEKDWLDEADRKKKKKR